MIKKIYRPIQRVLLRRKMCVGCTYPLEKIQNRVKLDDTKELVTCKCRRRYIKDLHTGNYRRATFEEEKEALNKS